MQLTKLIFPKTHLFVFLNAHLFVLWIMDQHDDVGYQTEEIATVFHKP